MQLSFCSCLLSLGLLTHAVTAADTLYLPQPPTTLPSLSIAGPYSVGVRTLSIVHTDQLEPLTQHIEDRPLVLEVWYPAHIQAAMPSGITQVSSVNMAIYENVTKSHQAFSVQGSAYRDAKPDLSQRYPLVVLSHGYTGYRTLMYYLGEHLASHGYVVVSIDHPHSTNREIDAKNAPYRGFLNTLYHRSRDQQFVLSHWRANPDLLDGMVDTTHAAVIGYSMGGYGAINTVGGCFNFTEQRIAAFTGSKDPQANQSLQALLNSCAGGQYQEPIVDSAWKAAIAIAPWGGQHRLFAPEALQGIKVPLLFFAGDQDDVSDYAGMQWLYEQTGSPTKYLLTYHNARHNIAPHPAPAVARNNQQDFAHYHEPAWSTHAINYINQHFALAMLDCHVKALSESCRYLQLSPTPVTATPSAEGQSGWLGFPARYDTGLSWQYQQTAPK
ncbi:alpha/beta hydrolase family protein [Alishewanella tabrizica]|uniref:Serine aminopeptidase S33 domain-containing protein n=1 Tax=Alishewanella tabrizica TaxID=671278 RepID=A0ABQ2WQZ0_9ALTE|nr:alpha/beta hydrolase [Alishewanella tabrizica]GGW67324.1 hypothetical protein GCM10008111_24180 [Alishewanella tabrizica]